MDRQSMFAPAGPEGERLLELSWLLFAGGGVIFLIVAIVLWLAAFAGPRLRAVLGARGFILAGGVAFPVVVLSALLWHTLGLSRALGLPADQPLRIEMVGHQFWWEVRYPGPPGSDGANRSVVTANEVRIPTGRDVLLEVASADVIHSVWIPALHGKIDMIPGRVNTRRLRAEAPGVLRGQCTEFCGTQHALMAFFVVAETPEDFAAWLNRQRLPATPPASAETALGMRVFGTAGCGGCHTVRGTPWTGRQGPDLTHVGSRLSLAAGTLANHRGTLAGWIAGSQDLKPGNAMPSFATALDGPELRALALWLEGLR